MNKQLRAKCIIGALFALMAVGTAQAFTFTFDEWGNGMLDGTTPVPYIYELDPSGGVAGPVLAYPLPVVAVGDVRVWEDESRTVLSDVLRFWTPDEQNYFMIFYSDQDATWEPADSGLPINPVYLDGGGVVENADGFFSYYASPNLYVGFSGRDEVPDGGFTVALLGLALAGLAGMRRSTAV